ncbi:MAG: STAS domain-containing protein [Leptospiraceae bacterium]|nr:STAS domain-containing protein [Leptospiraceae bacterium]MCB1317575.1 STAS domain-containing protein [Leptospiraceae bacterium]MCB1322551.1 STAS domain-containing protein [Leptospiraceae bacterium]
MAEIEINADRVLVRLDAPATTELTREELVFPENIRHILLDCRGVKMITSLPLAAIMLMLDREKRRSQLEFLNVEPELRHLLERTGLARWLKIHPPGTDQDV